uniref:Initiator protein NS1 n=1 Tax=Grus japonensis parvoviridae sp. TaxID=2794512 RepID=A0A8A4XCT8_9VIRU|nr:MAG: nonstructural protein 1 [Grus japonensis parvoviridae sp.]
MGDLGDNEQFNIAEDELREFCDQKCLHFCFKVPDILYTDGDGVKTEVTWQSVRKPRLGPGDEDFFKITQNGAEELWQSLASATADSVDHELAPHVQLSDQVLTAGVLTCVYRWVKMKDLDIDTMKIYCQSEVSVKNGWHAHVLLGDDGTNVTAKTGKWIQANFANGWRFWLAACLGNIKQRNHVTNAIHNGPDTDNVGKWVDLQTYRHHKTKQQYTSVVHYGKMIVYYFFKKRAQNNQKDQTNTKTYISCVDRGHKLDCLMECARLKLADKLGEEWREMPDAHAQPMEPPNDTEVQVRDGRDKAIEEKQACAPKSKNADSFQKSCNKAIKHCITEPDDFQCLFFDDYCEIVTKPGGEQKWKLMWETIPKMIIRQHSALSWILQQCDDLDEPTDPCMTKIGHIMQKNGYDVYMFMHMTMCVLNKCHGKQNTIVFDGPASTGKSLIAQSLAKAVGLVGCYNHSNENFPWSDCTDKLMIWVEEAPNFGKQVETFKCVMSGQNMRIDRKGKGSVMMLGAPVIMTTNNSIDNVQIGAINQPQHKGPIQARCARVTLNHRLADDFGIIEPDEWGRCFKWMVHGNKFLPQLAHFKATWKFMWGWTLQSTRGIKRKAEPLQRKGDQLTSDNDEDNRSVTATINEQFENFVLCSAEKQPEEDYKEDQTVDEERQNPTLSESTIGIPVPDFQLTDEDTFTDDELEILFCQDEEEQQAL